MRLPRPVCWLLVAAYFLTLAYFAFRPFRPVPGLAYGPAGEEWRGGAVQLGEGAALEETRGVSNLRKSLMASGQMSLEVLLQTDVSGQGGPARIITYSRNAMGRNFTLGQEGNGLVFRLRTTEANGQYECLLVPQVFDG
ncbi:MAG: hypothetical protein U9P12_10405, partial [Verrucomicrobiota bacterium]|nr:hypothetical protein [Verrucomicrobiota bacterium]